MLRGKKRLIYVYSPSRVECAPVSYISVKPPLCRLSSRVEYDISKSYTDSETVKLNSIDLAKYLAISLAAITFGRNQKI